MKVTQEELEFIQRFRAADKAGQELLFAILLCSAYCGEEFFEEVKEFTEKGDRAGIIKCVAKWLPIAIEAEKEAK